MSTATLILGNQLLKSHPGLTADTVIMIEAHDVCSRLPYHKHKLQLILSAMRHYRNYLESQGVKVEYVELTEDSAMLEELQKILSRVKPDTLTWMKPSDRPAHEALARFCRQESIHFEVYENAQFLTPIAEFEDWIEGKKKPLMEHFYRWQRKRLGILMANGKPEGGEWNYDSDNRSPLPKEELAIPGLPQLQQNTIKGSIAGIVDTLFQANPGSTDNFWLPVTHAESELWLDAFIEQRFSLFGSYEDAMKEGEPFLFHSTLSPLINCGLLTPQQVVDAALAAYKNNHAPINSVEGFIRQIIGWREYMHGIYWHKPDMIDANHFEFSKQLEDWWYSSDFEKQDLPIPVKAALRTVHEYGYNHHIERLMVLGNWFLLNEYDPKSVFTWFSAMYVDAYEWVMVPNVQGMSQYADGGFVATKPYISGGNYLQKMGSWWPTIKQAKESEFNTLYWDFLYKNKDKLKGNHRMAIALKQAEKMRG